MTSQINAVAPPADGSRRQRAGTDRERPWWHRSTVYQIYPRSFADSDGDGIGDIAGITQHLDHLADLGVDVIWLSPVYRSPQDDNGYDISDYQDVDPLFGDIEAMDALIAEAAKRDIGIVMDLVVNHTSDEHPWFLESRSSRDNPKRDWYWWSDPADGFDGHEPGEAPSGAEPTNWGSFFSGSTWAWDEATQQYYLHLFSRKQPDLNWENPEVREAVYAMMRWWLERGVAGFRMDVVNLISKRVGADGTLSDGVARPDGWGNGFPEFVDGPRMHEFLAEMHHEVFDAFPGTFLTVGEMPGVTLEQARLYTAPERREVDMVFQFEHMGLDGGPLGKFDPQPLHLPDLKRNLERWQKGLADVGGWNSLYWNNHDQPRILSRWGDDSPENRVVSAKTLGAILHLHQGTPYVYQGEELGMSNAHFTEARGLPGPGVAQLRGRRAADGDVPGGAARGSGRALPRQRTHAGAVGRLAQRRVHHRDPVDRAHPRLGARQRDGPGARPRLGPRALPPAGRAPQGSGRAGRSRRRHHHRRRLRAAHARPRPAVGVRPDAADAGR